MRVLCHIVVHAQDRLLSTCISKLCKAIGSGMAGTTLAVPLFPLFPFFEGRLPCSEAIIIFTITQ